ncbi:MAG: nitrite/sulfite reductase [Alphaproteobacteria bacterium GM7ARS4]|nr:nitrite/sulfite reductase [Alphaproteobacteria bacterium GM7ARS4]
MYRYDEFDHKLVRERAEQFGEQVKRRLAGELSEDEFKPLRLMNGLYLQLHAYMLRVAIPYGVLSSRQLRQLAYIAKRYDKDYGHFTTRQNIQFNWPKLEDVPAILSALASVEMHAIQTSGNCIRNVTADHYAGAALDEVDDPRLYSEIIRQWSTFHPEFSFLPRKFKIAVTGCAQDRAAIKVHDIGLGLMRREDGRIGVNVVVGGGQGRTPYIGAVLKEGLPVSDMLSYLEAILRVYNQWGRRDNLFKARIKILVHALGVDEMKRRVEEEWMRLRDGALQLPQEEVDRIRQYFAPPPFESITTPVSSFEDAKRDDADFALWVSHNVAQHRQAGYAIATISLKAMGGVPGDMYSYQMEGLADLTERYAYDEIRVSHEQNVVWPHVKQEDLYTLWRALRPLALATPNHGLITDMICCPGMDYCALATARSIPLAQRIALRFKDMERQQEIGAMKIKISGCINACGHHHVGHIGILGVDRRGEEYYQLSLGGHGGMDASLGEIVGPAFHADNIVEAVEKVIETYLASRRNKRESFLETYRRVGMHPFKERLYGSS